MLRDGIAKKEEVKERTHHFAGEKEDIGFEGRVGDPRRV